MGIIQVRRANVILDVPEEQQEEYLAKGFDVIGADGKVLVKTVPNDINSLKKSYTELLSEFEAMKKENEELKKQLASQKEETVEAEEPVESETVEEVEEKKFTPINKRSSKKQK